VDVIGFIAGQPDQGAANIFWFADPLIRNQFHQLAISLGRPPSFHLERCANGAGADGINANVHRFSVVLSNRGWFQLSFVGVLRESLQQSRIVRILMGARLIPVDEWTRRTEEEQSEGRHVRQRCVAVRLWGKVLRTQPPAHGKIDSRLGEIDSHDSVAPLQ